MSDIKIPEHIAIIMDGNGRWAKERMLPRNEGHRRGTKALEEIIDYANKIGVKYLTVYAFSTENWKRPQEEVDGLMKLFNRYLNQHLKKADKDSNRFNAIGDLESSYIPEEIKEKVKKLQEVTRHKTGLCFNMAFNYGGRDEIVRAFKRLAADVKDQKIDLDSVNEDTISSYLDTHDIPDPDLMIRTSGEMRTSNFLPWQLTYSEFYFSPCLWPDFTPEELDKAIEIYNSRQRRFGKSE